MPARFLRAALIAAAIALSAGFVAARPAMAADVSYDQLAADRGPSIVGLKFLLKVNAPAEMGGPREIQREVTGLMIDRTGLILVPNSAVGGNQADLPPGVTVTPAEMKVLIGEDSEGVAAKVIARDSELDLAWIRIDKPAEKGYTSLDLKQNPAAKLGDRLLFIDRMGNYYDRAVFVGEVKVSALLKKPRNLIQPGGLIFSLGTPVFTADGQFAGVTVRQGLGRDEMGGAVSQADQLYSQLLKVLPTDELAKATTRAIENAAKEPVEEKKEEKKDETKPAATEPAKDAPKDAPAPAPAPTPAPAPKP